MAPKKSKRLSPGQIAAVARLFNVLADASRLTLLQTLEAGPLTVSELVGACRMKQANVSKHLAVLHDHRLVQRERDGISVRYEIADPIVFAVCELVCGKMARDAKEAVALFNPDI